MLIEKIPDLINIGINSFKIEGRMRSYQYVSTVVKAYRYVIDNYKNDQKDAIKKGLEILENDFARAKTKYFIIDNKSDDFLISDKQKGSGTGIYLGKIKEVIEDEKRLGKIDKKEN